MKVRWTLIAVLAVSLASCSLLESLPTTSIQDATTPTDGLREALRVGTHRAVQSLGRADGYLGNVEVRIPVPRKMEKLAKALKAVGADSLVDDFVTGMNRAAEAAAPAGKQVFLDAIRSMTFDDALTILRGDAHEATDYLESKGRPRLKELFRPIVAGKLESAGATRAFDRLARKTETIPFLNRPVFDLEDYVTETALNGLFATIAKEEERIREDPIARTTELLRKWFGGKV